MTFLLFRVAPSNVARVILGANASPEAVRQLQEQLGLNRSLWVQLLDYLSSVARLDFGTSVADGSPVAETVIDKFQVTAQIGLLGSFLALLGSYLLNLAAYLYPRLRTLIHVVKSGVALPSFLTAILGAVLVGVLFPFISLSGYGSGGTVTGLLLPALIVALYPLALLTSVLREQITSASASDHAAAARSLGVGNSAVSKQVSQLEESLGVRLLQRTTRSLSLTAEGEYYLQECREILEQVDAARDTVSALADQTRGTLSISAPLPDAALTTGVINAVSARSNSSRRRL